MGGIGNQLFCYFAGYHLSQKNNADLEIDTTAIKKNIILNHSTIEDLGLSGNFIFNSRDRFNKNLYRILRRLNLFIPNLYKITKYYSNTEIGFDAKLELLRSPVIIEGYFQSYKYVNPYIDQIRPLRLQNKSKWLSEIEHELSELSFLAIHVRRGDYSNLTDAFGLLSLEYYLNGIRLARELGCTGPLVVFSDEIDVARKMLYDSIGESVYWIDPAPSSLPIESIYLMSLAKCVIIANSTFSWWAATLSKDDSIIIAPSKWFKNKQDPSYLLPPHWNIIDSKWID
jgi:hypothetical protein